MDRLLEATARAEQDHFWFRGFRRFVTPLVAKSVRGLTRAAILDCGCGTGNNLALLRRYGRAAGIDITWTGLVFAHGRGERAVARASATRLPFADATFDVVTSFDVIYSLADADETMALNEMSRVLRPGGHLVVNVAAMALLRGNHSVLGGEVRRYTRPELRSKLERCGFDVRRLTYTNATLFPVTVAVRALQRFRGVQPEEETQGDFQVPPAPLNALFSGALTVESRLIAAGIDMPVGSSLLCLARKPRT